MALFCGHFFIFIIFFLPPSRLDSDVLHPYPNGGHLDTKRNHRYVRDCQKIKHGNRTFEHINPKKTSYLYETMYIKNGSHYGHSTIVRNPLEMISVLEPMELGACKKKILSPVPTTAKNHKCKVAINAGFFNPNKSEPSYGECYGNIISNGKMVHNSNGIQNACFGIRKNGTIVIGYLSEDEVLEKTNPFLQMICGVGWVLRKGEIYLNESAKAECRDTETTGKLNDFFNVKAARSLIGYDSNGHVHLVQFDGKTHESGVNLIQAAIYMKSLGIINAVNFDGGGSVTYVLDSNMVNYPSSKCEANENTLCPRNVSSIICVHEGKHKLDHIDSLTLCCNRNYLIVIGMTVIIGISLLINVYICGFFFAYRSRFLVLSGATQKKEALKSLLDQNGHYSTGDDSDDDEI